MKVKWPESLSFFKTVPPVVKDEHDEEEGADTV